MRQGGILGVANLGDGFISPVLIPSDVLEVLVNLSLPSGPSHADLHVPELYKAALVTTKARLANLVSFSIMRFLAYFLLVCELTAAYTSISDNALRAIPGPGKDFDIKNGDLLAPILRPRVPGTTGSIAVQNHFADFFKTHLPKWDISYQNSTAKTPATGDKEIPFVNLVMSRDPPWTTPGEVSRLTLVAHFDSKREPKDFIGATDSAAPCAMLMHAARSIDAALTRKWSSMQKENIGDQGFLGIEEHKGIQIIFLDGEEAFVTWTHDDSLYGAKSLAAEMESTLHTATSTYPNELSSISLFVLLDLLGAAQPKVPSYFKTTHWAYQKLAALEKRFRDLSAFASSGDSWFQDAQKDTGRWMGGMVEDDHIPFMARGVEVLHVIPSPFPRVWHQIDDDGEHLDMDTVADWSLLVTAFAAEWMDLDGFLKRKTKRIRKRQRTSTLSVTLTKVNCEYVWQPLQAVPNRAHVFLDLSESFLNPPSIERDKCCSTLNSDYTAIGYY